MRTTTRFAAVLSALALLSSTLFAHDFWIEPESFSPAKGQILRVRLKVGDLGVSDNVARDEKHIVEFALWSDSGKKPLVGRDGQDVAGLVRLESEGCSLLGYVSNRSFVEMVPDKCAQYLRDKGLDEIAKLRAARGQTDQPSRELYSRSSKSLLEIGANADAGFDRMLHIPLELIPEKNPAKLGTAAGGATFEPLPVRLFFRDAPLANALVAALNLDEKHTDASGTLTARTDAEGRVRFALPRGGRWLIAAVHMLPAEKNEQNADWESFWGSLTFEMPQLTANRDAKR